MYNLARVCPFLQLFHESTKTSKRYSGVTAPSITEFVCDVATFNTLNCPLTSRYSVSEWQRDKEKKFFREKRRFCDLSVAMATFFK